MGSLTTVLLLVVIAGVLAISATARPCNTIFFLTDGHHFRKPNIPIGPKSSPGPFFITEFHRSTNRPVKFSIHDHTMDIISIVGALLFGAGCGGLTAATMYLIWSNRRLDFASDSDSDGYYNEDDVSTNKNCYVSVVTGTKEVPPSADAMKYSVHSEYMYM